MISHDAGNLSDFPRGKRRGQTEMDARRDRFHMAMSAIFLPQFAMFAEACTIIRMNFCPHKHQESIQ